MGLGLAVKGDEADQGDGDRVVVQELFRDLIEGRGLVRLELVALEELQQVGAPAQVLVEDQDLCRSRHETSFSGLYIQHLVVKGKRGTKRAKKGTEGRKRGLVRFPAGKLSPVPFLIRGAAQ